MIHKLQLNLKNNTGYPIFIGSEILNDDILINFFTKKQVFVLITNTTISSLWKNSFVDFFKKNEIKLYEIIIEDGEKYKNINEVEKVITFLLKNNCNRNTVLIALGGGVIGDLTGFVASIYQRGIKYVQIPTTLLSQVDASLGGKTGVNHVLGKNMIGSFWHPMVVFSDIKFLNTLPRHELISGIAEIVKYAILFDESFFQWIEENYLKIINLDAYYLSYCIKKCCEWKIKIVSEDERENNNRALLNLGHTYGHAIESYMNYKKWLHGEAVSVGMVIAARTAEILGVITSKHVNRIIFLLKNIGLPVRAPKRMNIEDYMMYMINDKKLLSNKKIRLILPTGIGVAKIFNDVDHNTIFKAVELSKL
ncbi:3-dehydroquinate synthase [Buchnera aphidicola (Kurisakia onigurumii)]|uniref:3-dehydroquinate synthase n=1 Tax=Buchnera aphidicola TaxID=9 RepID=UPI0031B73B8B